MDSRLPNAEGAIGDSARVKRTVNLFVFGFMKKNDKGRWWTKKIQEVSYFDKVVALIRRVRDRTKKS